MTPRAAAHQIVLEGRTIVFHLRRHPRARGVCMRVDPDRGLIVTIPRWLPLRAIPPALHSHEAWILRSLQRAEGTRRDSPPLVSPQMTIRLLGGEVPLRVHENGGSRADARLLSNELWILKPSGIELGRVIAAWYRHHARSVCAERISQWSALLGVTPTRLRIGDPRSRWGSCSATGTISLSWRLLLAPHEVLDYLVVHELCHLRVPGHPPKFWSLVESALPSYRGVRAWLRKNGDRLHAVR